MLALEHAPELRVSGRLSGVIAAAGDEQREWGHAVDRAAAPAAVAAAAPTAAIGISVLGAVIAGIALSGTVAPTTVAILMLLPLSAFEATAALPGAAVTLTRARIAARRLHDAGRYPTTIVARTFRLWTCRPVPASPWWDPAAAARRPC